MNASNMSHKHEEEKTNKQKNSKKSVVLVVWS